MAFVQHILNRGYVLLMRLTRRLSRQQLMLVLAVLVGLVAGLAATAFQKLLYLIEYALVSWFPADSAMTPIRPL